MKTDRSLSTALCALWIFALALWAWPSAASAGSSSADLGFTPQLNGTVRCTAVQPDGKILIGGTFTTVNAEARAYLQRLLADGTTDPSFTVTLDAAVSAIAVMPDGRIIIGGDFTTVNGSSRLRLARLVPDGGLDDSFQADANGSVYGLALQADSAVIAVGAFTGIGTGLHGHVARVNFDGTLDTTFNAYAFSDVYAVAIQEDGKILIGGAFTDVSGNGRSRIARLLTNGVVDSGFFPNLDGFVYALAVEPDGDILIGGEFGNVDSTPRANLARVSAFGVLDGSFTPDPDGSVQSIAVRSDGSALVAGQFSNIGGVARRSLALLDSVGTTDGTFDAALDANLLGVGIQADGRVLITGGFTTAGGQSRLFLARLLGTPVTEKLTASPGRVEWLRGGGAPEASNTFFELSTDGGVNWSGLGAGVRIVSPSPGWEINGLSLPQDGVVRASASVHSGNLSGSNGMSQTLKSFPTLDLTYNPSVTGSIPGVFATAVQPDGFVLIGGKFLTVGGSSHSGLARLDADGLVDASFTASVTGEVYGIAVLASGKILIVGTFTNVNGSSQRGIALLNSDGTTDASFTGAADDDVFGLCVLKDGKILISGSFTTIGGTGRDRLARLNADGSLDSSFATGVNAGPVSTVAEDSTGGYLIGGQFTAVGGVSRTNLARVLPDGSVDQNFTASPNLLLHTIAVQGDGKILIGGQFGSVNGTSRSRLARLLPDGTLDVTFDQSVNLRVLSIVPQVDGAVVVGGEFTTVAGVARTSLVRFNGDGTIDRGFDPTPAGFAPASATVNGVTLDRSGAIVVGGHFDSVDGITRTLTARLTNLAAKSDIVVSPPARIDWTRGGSLPEAQSTTFELSTDGGSTWQALGSGVRQVGGWYLEGLSLSLTGKIRTRARVLGGYGSASSSVLESEAVFFAPQTMAAATVTDNSATVSATIDNGGFASTARFSYSTEPTFVGEMFSPDTSVGNTAGAQVFTATLTGLDPGRTYYYRVVLSNVNGVFFGPVLTFRTTGVPPPVVQTGGDVPGEMGTKFLEFGAPTVDAGNVGGVATVQAVGQKPRTVIFGDAAGTVIASTGTSDGSGSTFLSLGDPVFAADALGFTAIAQVNPPPTSAPEWLMSMRLGLADRTRATTPRAGSKLAALYSQLSRASGLRQLARQGGDAPGVNGGIFARIPNFGLPRQRPGLLYTALLKAGGGVSSKNNFGIWRETAVPGVSAKLIRTGDTPAGMPEIRKLDLMIPVENASDQRRSFAPDGGVAAAAKFADGTMGIVRVAADGTVDVPVTSASAVPDEGNARFDVINAPAITSGGFAAFVATLRAIAKGQPAPSARAIFANRDGTLRRIARIGGELPGSSTQRFSRLGQPLMGQSGMIGFVAALTGKGVTPKNKTVLIQDRGGNQSVVARLGDPAAEFGTGATYQSFQSVVVTDTAQGHMVFTGTAAGTGVTKKNRQGLWAIGAAGGVKLLLRTDQPITVGAATLQVRVFEALTAKTANRGQGRSTDEDGFVAVKVTLTDGRKGILRLRLP